MAWYEAATSRVSAVHGERGRRPGFAKLTRGRWAALGLLHLRWATPALPRQRAQHAIRFGTADVLAHNGAIHPQDRLGEMLPPGWQRQLGGTTDSERYFLSIMARLKASGGDLPAAIAAAAADIEPPVRAEQPERDPAYPGQAVRDQLARARIPAAKLREAGYSTPPRLPRTSTWLSGQLRVGRGRQSGWPQHDWTPVPKRQVLVVDRRSLRADLVPLA